MSAPTGILQDRAAADARKEQIRRLYNACLSKETNLRSRHEDIRKRLLWEVSFRGRRFPATAGREQSIELIAASYLTLRNLLRRAQDPDVRWAWIAQWCKDEGIVSPHEMLPDSVFRRLTRKGREKLRGLSVSDFVYAELVWIWLPYSRELLADAKSLRLHQRERARGLEDLGYLKIAGERAMKRWHSPVEFTCDWLSDRGNLPLAKPRQDPDSAATLRNAYSRVFHPRRR
jgi:hypothetical protein